MIDDIETERIRERYKRRAQKQLQNKYCILNPAVYMEIQERERVLIKLFHKLRIESVSEKKVLEIGCGGGGNLLRLIQLGFMPENLVGNELLEERIKRSRELLPQTIKIIPGDARMLNFPEQSFDVVYQSVVFSSILDDAYQQELAANMWRMVKTGGGVLWYDFIYDNPSNPDVRGIPQQRIRSLFPGGKFTFYRVTLAPPIARKVTKIHPFLYSAFNLIPLLRTHVLCWIAKS